MNFIKRKMLIGILLVVFVAAIPISVVLPIVILTKNKEDKQKLDELWSGIKDELKKQKHNHLTKTPTAIGDKLYNLIPLFAAAKDENEYSKVGSELSGQAITELEKLTAAKITFQQIKDVLNAMEKFGKDIGWEIDTLEKKAIENKNFILYFGDIKCPHCNKAENRLKTAYGKNEANLKTILKEARENNQGKDVFFWSNEDGEKKEKAEFWKGLNTIIKMKYLGGENKIEATPALLFFKEGQLNDYMTGNTENLIKDIVSKAKEIFPKPDSSS